MLVKPDRMCNNRIAGIFHGENFRRLLTDATKRCHPPNKLS